MLNQVWCMTRLYDATHGKAWCIQKQHIKASLNMPETTYNNSGKSSYSYFEIGPDLNKHYVEAVTQQVKMQQDDLHDILVNLHIKFI